MQLLVQIVNSLILMKFEFRMYPISMVLISNLTLAFKNLGPKFNFEGAYCKGHQIKCDIKKRSRHILSLSILRF